MIDFIHIGDYKTGSTWMQNIAFPAHPEIQYLGDPCEDRELSKLLTWLVLTRDVDFKADFFKNKFQDKIKKINQKNKITGLSRELLCSSDYISGEHAKRNAERLKAVFGGVKIIYIIREQTSMVRSIYSQYIKRGGTLNLNDFLFDPFTSSGVFERLKYHKTIEIYQKIFGKQNVWIGLFEEFKADKTSFLKSLYSFIGCNNNDFYPPKDIRINKALSHGSIKLMRFFNHFIRSPHNTSALFLPIDTLALSFLSERKKKQIIERNWERLAYMNGHTDIGMQPILRYAVNIAITYKLARMAESISFGGKINMGERIEKFIKNEVKDSNNILLRHHNFAIDKYNWPL